jgi:predicted enzyme related to lactoylglutathione lyase
VAEVLGIGGVFFKSPDPKALSEWYGTWLGFSLEENGCSALKPERIPPGGCTVWSPFKETTDYFAPSKREFMINFMVDDLEGVLAKVAEGGAEVMEKIEEGEYGRFGWFLDPDGNKIELWQPPAKS